MQLGSIEHSLVGWDVLVSITFTHYQEVTIYFFFYSTGDFKIFYIVVTLKFIDYSPKYSFMRFSQQSLKKTEHMPFFLSISTRGN